MAEPAEAQESRQLPQAEAADSLWPSDESPQSCLKNCLAKHLLVENANSMPLPAAEEYLQQQVSAQKNACQQPLQDLLASDDHFDVASSGRTMLVRLKVEYLKQSVLVMKQVNAIWPIGTGPENAAKHTLAKHLVYSRDPSVAKYSMQVQDACGLLKALLPESKAVTNKYQLKSFLYSDPFFSIVFTTKNDGVVKLKVPRLLSVSFVQAKGKASGGKAAAPAASERFEGDLNSSSNNSEADVSSTASAPHSGSTSGKPTIEEINAVVDVVFPPSTGPENETKGMVAKRLALEGHAVTGSHSMPLANIGNFLKEQSRDAWANCKGGLRFAFANDPYFELSRWNTNWKVCLRVDALFAAAAAQASASTAARNINKPSAPTSSTASPPSRSRSPTDSNDNTSTKGANGVSRPNSAHPNRGKQQHTPPAPATTAPAPAPRPNGLQLPFHIPGGSNVSVLALPKDVAQVIDQEWPNHSGPDIEYKNFVAKVLVSKGDPSLGLYAMTLAKLGQHLRRFASDFKLKESLMRDDRFEVSHTSVTEVVVRLLLDMFHSTNNPPRPTAPGTQPGPAHPKEPAVVPADPPPVQKQMAGMSLKQRQAAAGNQANTHRQNNNAPHQANNSRAPAPSAAPPPAPTPMPAPALEPTPPATPPTAAAPVVPTPELYKRLFTCKGSRVASGNPEWRYKDHSGNQGPVSADQIAKLCDQRRINEDTPVCGCNPEVKHPNLPGSKFYKPLSALLALVNSGASYDPVTKADVKRAKPSPGWNEPATGGAAAAPAGAAGGKFAGPTPHAAGGARGGAAAHSNIHDRPGPGARARPAPGPGPAAGPAPGGPGGPGPDHPMFHQGPAHMRGNLNNMHGRAKGNMERGFGMRPGPGSRGKDFDNTPAGRQSSLHVNAMPFIPAAHQVGQVGGKPGQQHPGFGPLHNQGQQQVGMPAGSQALMAGMPHSQAQMAAMMQGQLGGAKLEAGLQQQVPATSMPQQQANITAASLFANGLLPRGLQGLGLHTPIGVNPLKPTSPGAGGQITSLSAGLDAAQPAATSTLLLQQQPQPMSMGIPTSMPGPAAAKQSPIGEGVGPQPQAQALQGADFLGQRPLLQPRVPGAGNMNPNMSVHEMQLLQHYQLLQQQRHQHHLNQQQQQQQQQQALTRMGHGQDHQLINVPPQPAPINVQRELAFQLFAHGKPNAPDQPLWWFADQVVVHGPFFAGQMIEWFLQGIIKEDLRVCCTTQDFQRPLTPALNRFHSVAELIMMLGKGGLLPPLPRPDVAMAHNQAQYHQYMLPMMMSAAAQQQQQQAGGHEPHAAHFLGGGGHHQHHFNSLLTGIQGSQAHGF